jgi:hypothetical protein
MPDPSLQEETAQKPTDKKKSALGRLKESVDDPEEQLAIISTFVRLGILVWSGAILTLAYIKLPPALGIPEQKLDPTFIASVFTGVLATFGVQTAKDKKSSKEKSESFELTPEQMQRLIDKAAANNPPKKD